MGWCYFGEPSRRSLLRRWKGSLSIADMITGGSVNKERMFFTEIVEGAYYPTHEAVNFYHCYKEDIALFGEMGLKHFTSIHCMVAYFSEW